MPCPSEGVVGPSSCALCSLPGFELSMEGECEEVCGDGVRVGNAHECDDGNTVDGDGCSSSCEIETGYHCSGESPASADKCERVETLTILMAEVSPSLELVLSFSHPLNWTGEPFFTQISFSRKTLTYS